MSICLTWFPIGGLGEHNNKTSIVLFYKEGGRLWRYFRQLYDCPTYTIEKVWE